MARLILPDPASQFGMDPQGGEIAPHIGGTTRVSSFLFYVNHGNGGFRGDAGNPAVNKLVEHEVAHHEDAESAEPGRSGPELARGEVHIPHP